MIEDPREPGTSDDPADVPPAGADDSSFDIDDAEAEYGQSMLEKLHEVAGGMATVQLGGGMAAPPGSRPERGTGSRYHAGPELGRGGMGRVLSCEDRDLGRVVAMKVLHERVARLPGMAQRFVEEARIAGQLQHPGIAPVHDLGVDSRARPFFIMKMVEGETLGDQLAARPHPGSERQRYLGIFEQLCQAMAYAHSRGVVHRDLKPANVMVGAFGEVMVMDWGLARLLRGPSRQDDVGQVEMADVDDSTSEAGTVMGTPAYMPREQARGEIEAIDTRSDVFSLGCILCLILTGKAVYLGRRQEVLAQAAEGRVAPAHARLRACDADSELVELARRCLSPAQEDRPGDAGELAQALAAHREAIDARARTAELEAATARGRAAEERKARRLTVALAATVVLAVVVGSAGYGWLHGRQRAAANHGLGEVLSRASRLWGEAQAAGRAASDRWRAALVAAEQVETLSESNVDDRLRAQGEELVVSIRAEAARVERDHDMLDRLESIRLEHGARFDWQTADPPYEEAFRDYGLDLAQSDEELAAAIRASAVRDELVAALDVWGLARSRSGRKGMRLLEIANLADDSPHRRQLRLAIGGRDVESVRELAAAPDLEERSAGYIDSLALSLHSAKATQNAVEVYRRGLLAHPDSFWLHHNLGMVLGQETPPRPHEAARHMTAALALGRGSARMWLSVGNQLLGAGDRVEAIRHYRHSIELEPDNAKAWNNLGIALKRGGDAEGARRAYERACSLDASSADAHYNLALLLSSAGEVDQARLVVGRAMEIEDGNPAFHVLLAKLLARAGREQEALVETRKGLAVAGDDARAHHRLADVLNSLGRYGDAADSYRRATEIDPRDWRSWVDLGTSLRRIDRSADAFAAYTAAAAAAPLEAHVHCALGHYLKDEGRYEEALEHYLLCDAIGSRRPRWQLPSAEWLETCRDGLNALPRLDAIAGDEESLSAQEAGELAVAALSHHRYRLAVGLFDRAFAADPRLAEQVRGGMRYHAARAAVGAALGAGRDEEKPSEEEQARWRLLALRWLIAERRALESADALFTADGRRSRFASWLQDSLLAATRDSRSQDWPEEERERWAGVWDEIRAGAR